MELWIRSQDKMKLVKANYVYIMESNNHFTMYGETIDSSPIIGTYKSKERALEVFDEITELLKPKFDIDVDSIKLKLPMKDEPIISADCRCDVLQLNTYVYEMPIE